LPGIAAPPLTRHHQGWVRQVIHPRTRVLDHHPHHREGVVANHVLDHVRDRLRRVPLLRHALERQAFELVRVEETIEAGREKGPLTCGFSGGRYWDRTSDLFGVNEALSR
jgi:hypothetical protein